MQWIKDQSRNQVMYWGLFLLITVVSLYLAFFYTHQQPSQLDEGAFLVKGYYFVTGQYTPFQEYGFWTNKMPLSFYVPGLAQALFSPGLQTGRYFSIFLFLSSLAALWMLIRRLRGKWWALLGVAVFGLNPTLIMINVKANSQVVAVFFLSWALFFLLGEDRKPWQVAVGSFLCAMVVLTRQNLVFLLPFVVIYAFWLHGRHAGWSALAGAGIPMLALHVIYYPDIFWIWMEWMPASIRNLIGFVLLEGGGSGVWNPRVDFLDRASSFFMTIRFHFFSLLGVFLACILLIKKKAWKSRFEWRMVFMLCLLFVSLFGIHAWASLTKNYCVFCFAGYVSFFIPLGLVISLLALSSLVEKRINLSPVGVAAAIVLIVPGLFFGSISTVGRWVVRLPAPRFKGGRMLSGNTELGILFSNRFGWDADQALQVVPPLFGLACAAVLILLLWVLYRMAFRNRQVGLGYFLTVSFFGLAVLFTPTHLLGQSANDNTCGADILAAYESAGEHLAEVVPPGASVYWNAGSVVTPLIYITHANPHPPQLNGIYSFRQGGDRDLLEKKGFYNEESGEIWRQQDDIFLISERYFSQFWREFLDAEHFVEHNATNAVNPCQPDSAIRIFERIRF